MKYLLKSECFNENKNYLKTYENLFSTISKKYIVIKSYRIDIPYYILKIKKIENDTLIYSEYYYIKKNGKLDNLKAYNKIKLDTIKNVIIKIIYQTDNLDKAIEILKLSNNITKYNI